MQVRRLGGVAGLVVELLDEFAIDAFTFGGDPGRRLTGVVVCGAGLAEVGRTLATFKAVVLGRGELRHRLQRLDRHRAD